MFAADEEFPVADIVDTPFDILFDHGRDTGKSSGRLTWQISRTRVHMVSLYMYFF